MVELDGGQHTDADAAAYDARRTHLMEQLGLRVVRFSDVEALKDSDAVAATILREVEGRVGDASPRKPPP